QRRGATAARLGRDAAGLREALCPDHHYAGTDPIMFGGLTPRGPRHHVFYHADTKLFGIGLWHRSLPASLIDKHLAILPNSTQAKFALTLPLSLRLCRSE